MKPPRPRRILTALVPFVALALLLSACGGATEVDYRKASDTVRASLESKREGFGVTLENVGCPKGVKVEPGVEFECTVRYPDGRVAYALLKIRTAAADLNLETLSPRPILR